MVPSPPELMKERLRVKREYLAELIWFWPTSVTTIASPPESSETFATTSPMFSGPAPGRSSGAMTSLSSTSK